MTLPAGTPRCTACGAAFSSLRLKNVHRCPALATGLLGPSVLRFEFPLPPKMANDHAHWSEKRHQRQEFYDACDGLVAAKRAPKAPAQPWAKAAAVVTLRTMRAMDSDNMVARTKYLWDFLVTRHYLVDDGPDRLALEVHQERAPQGQRGLTLELRRLA